jgi:hypothetical protein
LKPAQANSSQDPILKKPITKKGLVEWLKVKTLSSNHSLPKKKKVITSILKKKSVFVQTWEKCHNWQSTAQGT